MTINGRLQAQLPFQTDAVSIAALALAGPPAVPLVIVGWTIPVTQAVRRYATIRVPAEPSTPSTLQHHQHHQHHQHFNTFNTFNTTQHHQLFTCGSASPRSPGRKGELRRAE